MAGDFMMVLIVALSLAAICGGSPAGPTMLKVVRAVMPLTPAFSNEGTLGSKSVSRLIASATT